MNDAQQNTPQADEVFQVIEPERRRAPFVFASPHSGTQYPEAFKAQSPLDFPSLRRSEDSYVDEIYGGAVAHGAPLLKALFPRAYVDPNREAWELDPEMFAEPLPPYVNTDSLRVKAGLGTIAKVVTDGKEIYGGKLTFAEAEERIHGLYQPYHDRLADLIAEVRAEFGVCVLIDCHSMPSVGGPMDRDIGDNRTDFVLGDRFGASCAPSITAAAEVYLTARGYNVRRNDPYAGGFTTAHYGRPTNGVHALQIEVNRHLYMDEQTYEKRPGFDALRETLDGLVGALTGAAEELSPPPTPLIRDSRPEDMPTITALYGHYVANTTVNFEEVPPSEADMAARREAILDKGYPYLVAETKGRVVGFAYAGPFRPRSAYRHTLESSIYLAPEHLRKGYGRALMTELLDRCKALGVRQVIAMIGDSANESSQALHASLGFQREGVLRRVGLKFGRWIDVVIMHKELTPPEE